MANEEHVEILKQGVEVWNKWREENPDIKPDLSQANLNVADLSEADLRGADLRGANLSGADLREADLSQADLSQANLSDANLSVANLSEADLNGVNLDLVNLKRAKLSNADLRLQYLSGADLSGADLSEADLSEADLSEANLSGTDLRGADLREANLNGADLKRAHLRGADLRHACLSEADLSQANLSQANLNVADLSEANLSQADLSHACLSQANLSQADLRGADLCWADLRGADLRGADLSQADLCGADLSKADLSEANLSQANLSNTILVHCNLYHTKCLNTILKNSNLTGIIFNRIIVFEWNIKDVICDYIYLDRQMKDRSPADRNFETGEFERLYTSIPTVEYVFKNGMHPYSINLMDWLVTQIQNEKPNLGLELISFDRKGYYPKATFAVASEEVKDMAHNEIKRQYEEKVEILRLQNDQSQKIIEQLLQHNRILLEQHSQPKKFVIKGDYYETHGNVQNIKIKNVNIKNSLNDIKEILDKEPPSTFKQAGLSKTSVKQGLKQIIQDAKTGAVEEIGKKLLDLGINNISPLIPALVPILDKLI